MTRKLIGMGSIFPFEAWEEKYLRALYTSLERPNAVAYRNEIFAAVLLEIHRRGLMTVQWNETDS